MDLIPELLKNDKTIRIIAICLPDFETKKLNQCKKWGYNFPEIIALVSRTIDDLITPDMKFNLILHDWGTFIGIEFNYLYVV